MAQNKNPFFQCGQTSLKWLVACEPSSVQDIPVSQFLQAIATWIQTLMSTRNKGKKMTPMEPYVPFCFGTYLFSLHLQLSIVHPQLVWDVLNYAHQCASVDCSWCGWQWRASVILFTVVFLDTLNGNARTDICLWFWFSQDGLPIFTDTMMKLNSC